MMLQQSLISFLHICGRISVSILKLYFCLLCRVWARITLCCISNWMVLLSLHLVKVTTQIKLVLYHSIIKDVKNEDVEATFRSKCLHPGWLKKLRMSVTCFYHTGCTKKRKITSSWDTCHDLK